MAKAKANIPEDLRYTETHEWVRVEGNRATVGITDVAQSRLGDIVFIELPESGAQIERGEEFSALESVKAASSIFAPVGGRIVAVNERLADAPQLVNGSPYDEGWIARIALGDPSEIDSLMGAAAYAELAEKD